MEQTVMKRFVCVIAAHDTDGKTHPMCVVWEDGAQYEIEKVEECRRMATTRAGGVGLRYAVRIRGKRKYLYEDEGRWFVEAKC